MGMGMLCNIVMRFEWPLVRKAQYYCRPFNRTQDSMSLPGHLEPPPEHGYHGALEPQGFPGQCPLGLVAQQRIHRRTRAAPTLCPSNAPTSLIRPERSKRQCGDEFPIYLTSTCLRNLFTTSTSPRGARSPPSVLDTRSNNTCQQHVCALRANNSVRGLFRAVLCV